MQAIIIKYLPATNTRGVRLKAIAEAGSIIESRNYELDCNEQARALAERFIAEKYHGNCKLYGFGCLPNGDYVATLG